MLHIVLLILKIIGILLLCILGLLLLAIVCVLFVPVRYRIELNREEGEGKPPLIVKAKITWLLHLMNILVRYPAEVYVRVRILFLTLFRVPGKQKESGKPARSPAQEAQTTEGKQSAQEKQTAGGKQSAQEKQTAGEEPPMQEKQAAGEEPPAQEAQTTEGKQSAQEKQTAGEEQPIQENRTAQEKQASEDSKPEESPRDIAVAAEKKEKIKGIFQKIKEFFQNIQYTIEHFCDKIKSVLEQAEYYKEIVTSEVFRQSFQLCKGELASILKSLKPQKFEADVIVGMDDPATTGQILAIWGMLYPVIGEHVNVTGDFEQNRIEGYVLIKGRIRGITFVKTAIRIALNKDIRKLIHLLKKEAVSNGRK